MLIPLGCVWFEGILPNLATTREIDLNSTLKSIPLQEITVTWSQTFMIIPKVIGHTIMVHNGKEHLLFI